MGFDLAKGAAPTETQRQTQAMPTLGPLCVRVLSSVGCFSR